MLEYICPNCGYLDTERKEKCYFCDYVFEKTEDLKNGPSIAQKATGFIKSTISHAADGFANVSSEKKKQRQDICNACEFINKDNNTCNQCGCYLDVKTSWRTTSCPIGKWGPEEAKTENGIILPAYSRPAKKCGGCGKKS
jgi:hypothetical protein